MSAFDSLKKRVDKEKREKEAQEKAKADKLEKWYRQHKRYAKKYENIVTPVLKDLYNSLYRDKFRAENERIKKDRRPWAIKVWKVGYLEEETCFGIFDRYNFTGPSEGRSYEYHFAVKVTLAYHELDELIGFRCEIGRNTGQTKDLSKKALEQLLIELYEKSQYG